MTRTVLVAAGPERPSDDPVPWLTETWRRNGCFTTSSVDAMVALRDRMSRGEKIEGAAAFSSEVTVLNAILGAVRSTVSGMHEDKTPYGVQFAATMDTAATDLLRKVVIIGTKALTDPTLTDGQKAAILTGIAGHEVGHINGSQEFTLAVVDHWKGTPDYDKALALSNIGDDNRVERLTIERYPGGIATCINAAMWFISRQQIVDLLAKGVEFPIRPKGLTARDRKQCLTLASRYPHLADWTGQSAMDMLMFGHSWAARMAECVSPTDHVALVQEALDWINDVPDIEDDQEDSESNEDEEQDEDDSEESEDSTDEGEPCPTGDSSDEESDDESDGESNDGDADDDAEGDDEDGDGAGDDSDESESDDEGDGDGEADDEDDDESTEGGDTPTGKSKQSDDGEADEDGEQTSGKGDDDDFGNPSDPWSDEGDEDDDASSQGDDDGESFDDEDEDSDDESDESDSDGDEDGDEDSDDDSDESESDGQSDDQSDTKQSDHDWSEERSEPKDEMPDLGDCITEAARDPKDDALAEAASAAHQRAQTDVQHMRRYPDAVLGMAKGGVLVYRRELTREQRLNRKRGMGVFFAAVNDSDEDAQKAAGVSLPVAGEPIVSQANGGTHTMDSWAQYSQRRVSIESPTRAAAIAATLNSARRGAGMPERGVRSGRIDRSRLARVANMDTRVFVNRSTPAPQKLRVHILLDASASMRGERANNAVQAGRDLISAMDTIPWIKGRVYAQTDDYLGTGLPFVAPLWESGEKRELIDDYHALVNGNTPEGYALAYVCDDLLAEQKPGERGVVIVVSDGEPSYVNGHSHVAEVVGYYRRRGLRIVSVSVAGSLQEATQRRMYGEDFLAYNPNVSLFARSLAKVIGSSL